MNIANLQAHNVMQTDLVHLLPGKRLISLLGIDPKRLGTTGLDNFKEMTQWVQREQGIGQGAAW